jgi:hypothetical protein
MASEAETLERVKPWALVLKDMLEALEANSKLSLGEMIREFSARRGVSYPPRDVEELLLTAAFRRAASGAPAPKGSA